MNANKDVLEKSAVKTVNKKYLRTKIESATQGELILMLYNGALGFLSQGKKAVESKDHDTRNEMLNRVEGILYELLNSLDEEKGGEVAKSLKSIYVFLISHLYESKIKSSTEGLDNIQRILSDLRDAWNEIIAKPVIQTDSPNGGLRLPSIAI